MKSYKTLIFIIVVIVLLAAVCLLFPSDGVPFLGRRLFFPTLKEVLSPEKSVSVDEKMRVLEESIKMQAITDSINTARETARQDSIRFYKKFLRPFAPISPTVPFRRMAWSGIWVVMTTPNPSAASWEMILTILSWLYPRRFPWRRIRMRQR